MTQTVQFDDLQVDLSQPLKDRPDVIVIATSDGRCTVIGDGLDPFTADEYRQFYRSVNNDRGLRRQAATS